MSTGHRHVFLSYCRDNSDEVRRLREDLSAAGESVWWDGDIPGGLSWEFAVRQALKRSYAVVVCLSRESEEQASSGI